MEKPFYAASPILRRASFFCSSSGSMFKYCMASIQFSCISTARARISRKHAAALGKMRTTRVRRLKLFHQPLQHVGGFKILVVLTREPVKAKCLSNVVLHPTAQLGIALAPFGQPSCHVLPRLL